MTPITLQPIAEETHAADALDLAERARDYVVLEVGRAPDADYIHDFFTALPPDVGPDGLMTFAVMQGDAMVGMTCVAEGYEFHDDWWIGLMLLDPAYRGMGHGSAALDLIKGRAQARNIAMLKLSVLAANPRALKFWQREGFVFHRDAPALPGSDGHDRVVLKFIFHTPPGRPF
jgi:GNAT superfamily N-acetyltransferase